MVNVNMNFELVCLIKLQSVIFSFFSPRPELYRCYLFWKDNTTLIIGWAKHIQVIHGTMTYKISLISFTAIWYCWEHAWTFNECFVHVCIYEFSCRLMFLLKVCVVKERVRTNGNQNPEHKLLPSRYVEIGIIMLRWHIFWLWCYLLAWDRILEKHITYFIFIFDIAIVFIINMLPKTSSLILI